MDKRWNEIKAIWNKNEWMWGLGGFVVGALVVMAFQQQIFSSDMIGNLFSEGLGIAFTVLIIERLSARRDDERRIINENEKLVDQLSHPLKEFHVNAIHELMRRRLIYGDTSILKGKHLSGANLSDNRLDGIDISNSILVSANLSGSSFHKANFQNTNLWVSILDRSSFREANFENANLWYGKLRGTRVEHSILINTNLRNADLTRADFWCSNLENADLEEADLSNTSFIGANLRNANLTKAKINHFTIFGRAGLDIDGVKSTMITVFPDGKEWVRELSNKEIAAKYGMIYFDE